MKKFIPFVPAALITILYAILEIHIGAYADPFFDIFYRLRFSISGIVALLLFAAAWHKGQNSEESFYKVVILSMGGILAPVLIGIKNHLQFVLVICFFLLPVVLTILVGRQTRRYSYSTAKKMFFNSLPGMFILGLCIGLLVGKSHSSLDQLTQLLKPFILYAIVVFASAYTETLVDPAERRHVQWRSWLLFLLLTIIYVIAVLRFSYTVWKLHAFITLTLPIIMWYGKNWIQWETDKQNMQVLVYFMGAFFLNIFQAERLWLLDGTFDFYEESFFLGCIIALLVFWQKPAKITIAAIVGSVAFVLGNFGVLLAFSSRFNKMVSGLVGNNSVAWVEYHINTTQAFISGDLTPLYALYEHTENRGFMHAVANISIPYALPLTLAILFLTVLTAILLVKYAKNRQLAEVVAISIVVQALIFALGKIVMIVGGVDPAFSFYYLVEFVVMWWLLRPDKEV